MNQETEKTDTDMLSGEKQKELCRPDGHKDDDYDLEDQPIIIPAFVLEPRKKKLVKRRVSSSSFSPPSTVQDKLVKTVEKGKKEFVASASFSSSSSDSPVSDDEPLAIFASKVKCRESNPTEKVKPGTQPKKLNTNKNEIQFFQNGRTAENYSSGIPNPAIKQPVMPGPYRTVPGIRATVTSPSNKQYKKKRKRIIEFSSDSSLSDHKLMINLKSKTKSCKPKATKHIQQTRKLDENPNRQRDERSDLPSLAGSTPDSLAPENSVSSLPSTSKNLSPKKNSGSINKRDKHKKRKVKCLIEECQTFFGRRTHMTRHLKEKHKKLANGNPVKRKTKFKCPDEDCQKEFLRLRNLNEHRIRVHDTKGSKCDKCKKVLKNAYALKMHLRRTCMLKRVINEQETDDDEASDNEDKGEEEKVEINVLEKKKQTNEKEAETSSDSSLTDDEPLRIVISKIKPSDSKHDPTKILDKELKDQQGAIVEKNLMTASAATTATPKNAVLDMSVASNSTRIPMVSKISKSRSAIKKKNYAHKVKCPVEECQNFFGTRTNMNRHFKEVHHKLPNGDPVPPRKKFKCPEEDCENEFARLRTLTEHQARVHDTTGSVECKKCKKLMKNVYALKLHYSRTCMKKSAKTEEKTDENEKETEVYEEEEEQLVQMNTLGQEKQMDQESANHEQEACQEGNVSVLSSLASLSISLDSPLTDEPLQIVISKKNPSDSKQLDSTEVLPKVLKDKKGETVGKNLMEASASSEAAPENAAPGMSAASYDRASISKEIPVRSKKKSDSIKKQSGDKKKKVKCLVTECQKVFGSRTHMNRHLKEIHQKLTNGNSMPSRMKIKCPEENCQKEFSRLRTLNEHRTRVHDEASSVCKRCKKVLKNSYALNLHLKRTCMKKNPTRRQETNDK